LTAGAPCILPRRSGGRKEWRQSKLAQNQHAEKTKGGPEKARRCKQPAAMFLCSPE